MIASNKERQEHNNLGTIWREKVNGLDMCSEYKPR